MAGETGIKARDVQKKGIKSATKDYVTERVDFKEVDGIFDDIIDEELNSVFYSLINLSMVCVMAVSAYLWLKLSKVGV